MKCQNCGAEIEQGDSFCRECGSKVLTKKFCRECGAELLSGAKFCSSCGADVDFINKAANLSHRTEQTLYRSKPTIEHRTTSSANTAKRKSTSYYRNQMSKGAQGLNTNKMLITVVAGVAVILLFFLLIFAKTMSKKNESLVDLTPTFTTTQNGECSIALNAQYAYMSDEWNVYIAVPISDSVIKIEHWDKTMNSSKKVKYSEDIGSFKLNDSENGFAWIDDEHTAFIFNLKDKNNSRVNGDSVIFTINISDSDVCKGTDYDEKIACYSYQNDDWHNYRAIPLSDKLIKIECWYRGNSMGKFLFGYDMCVLNPNSNDTDFEWNSDKSAFTITIKDPVIHSYWKESTFVSFTLENPDYEYYSALDFLGKGISVSEKMQKDGFSDALTVNVGEYSFSVPTYWNADIKENGHYRAYAETSGKVAMLEIYSLYDDEDPVTYEILAKETEEGLMSKSFASWYESCGDITVAEFDNGTAKGFTYEANFSQYGYNGYSKSLCFPDEKNNMWFFVILSETDNTEFTYTKDFDRILHSIKVNDNQSVSEQPKEEIKQEETKKEDTKQETTSVEVKKSSIPSFEGSSLDSAVKSASEFGVSEDYDEDFGHGTRCKAMSDSAGGLMIDIIYVSSTKEIVSACITTNKLAASSDQEKFVKEMASVLCPSSDSSDVSSWVSNNVGGKKTTTIGGFTYEISLGPVDNVLYYAGNAEWEEWEFSQ